MKQQEIIFSHLRGGGCFPVYTVDKDNDNDGMVTHISRVR